MKSFSRSATQRLILALALISYVIALAGPAYLGIDPRLESTPGWKCLLMGWLGTVASPKLGLAWFTNILLALTIALWKKRSSKVTAALAFLFSLVSLSVDKMVVDEAGNAVAVRVGYGLFFWIASVLLVLIARMRRA